MRTRLIPAIVAAIVLTLAGNPVTRAAPPGTSEPPVRKACGGPRPGRFQCLALLRTTADGKPLASDPSTPAPAGFGPAQIQDAYQLTAAAASHGDRHTVALIDAYDDPNAESDLAAYRARYGLPPCTTANGCFRKVNENGDPAPLPQSDANWGVEISLDLDMVSATCPRCHILLVEADDNVDTNLAASVATAAKLGATEISNSYGEPEYADEAILEPFFDQPGVMITAASGDAGYGVGYPAASANVTSVGGTTLWQSSSTRGWSESVWPGTGSGCSAYIRKPSWQHDSCTHRTDNDVAAVADPATALAVYDTFAVPGWVRVGGTSAASPIVASVYALAEDTHHSPAGSYFYSHRNQLFDVTSGTDGSCSPSYLCAAGTGYDAPTGLGTPNLTGTTDVGGTCVNGWSRTPSQAFPTYDTVANADGVVLDVASGIDALARDDVWTVGTYQAFGHDLPAGNSGFMTNIEHWTGSAWQRSPSPDPVTISGTTDAQLTAVSFDRTDDGWAAGTTGPNPLVTHWDGDRWTISATLNPIVSGVSNGDTIPANAVRTSIAAISPDDVWLAGNSRHGLVSDGAFLEHWDGSTWHLVGLPGASTFELYGLHALSASDIWAVGTGQSGSVTVHWDGRTWSQVVDAGGSSATLESVSGSAPDDVWAVGAVADPAANSIVPLTEHWDGRSWTVVPTVNGASVASNKTTLWSVAVLSPSDAWAVGSYSGSRGTQPNFGGLYLLEHFDGHQWTIVPAPQTGTPDRLKSIFGTSSTGLWIAASEQLSGVLGVLSYPFVLRNGCRNG